MPVNRDTERENATAKLPSHRMMFVEFPAATALFIIASLNLAYRPLWLILLACALLFATFRAYLRWRYGIQVPAVVLLLAFAAVGVNTAGNHFRWYQQLPWPIASWWRSGLTTFLVGAVAVGLAYAAGVLLRNIAQ